MTFGIMSESSLARAYQNGNMKGDLRRRQTLSGENTTQYIASDPAITKDKRDRDTYIGQAPIVGAPESDLGSLAQAEAPKSVETSAPNIGLVAGAETVDITAVTE